MNQNELESEETDQDIIGNVLAALDHIATISDDLYSVIGETDKQIDDDLLNKILGSYEILSAVYESMSDEHDMPSLGYDDEADNIANESAVFESKTWHALLTRLNGIGFDLIPTVNESQSASHTFGKKEGDSYSSAFLNICSERAEPFSVTKDGVEKTFTNIVEAIKDLQKIKTPEPLSEGTTWKNLVKLLTSLGFKAGEPGKDYGNAEEIAHLFGIPMRAGKWADTWFVIAFDDSKPYTIVNADKTDKYDKLSDAVTALKKLSGSIKEANNWAIIEDLGDNEIVTRLSRIKDVGFHGMASEATFDAILSETAEYDEKLTQAIIEFRDAEQAKADSQLAREPVTEDDNTIQEGRSFDTFSDANLKKWLVDNWTYSPKISAALANALKTAAAEATKRNLKWTARNVNESVPSKKSIQTWNLAKGQMDPYRLEVIGQDSSDVARILDKVLPGNKGNAYDDQLGFKSTADREKAAKAIVDFYKNLKEEDCSVIPLGNLSESIDEDRFRKLAQTGLVDKDQVTKVVKAMKDLEGGKTLNPDQKNLITSTFQNLIGLVTGDASVFAKIQSVAKKEGGSNANK